MSKAPIQESLLPISSEVLQILELIFFLQYNRSIDLCGNVTIVLQQCLMMDQPAVFNLQEQSNLNLLKVSQVYAVLIIIFFSK